MSNVIQFPMRNAHVPVAPIIAALDEHVSILFPPDVSIKTLGLALACMGLRLESRNTGGRLVVRRLDAEAP